VLNGNYLVVNALGNADNLSVSPITSMGTRSTTSERDPSAPEYLLAISEVAIDQFA
jgi:hypothetical protein